MVNRYQPHVLVLPEDDANRQVANGFVLGLDLHVQRRIQILEVAGGWNEVLNRFESDHITRMDRFAEGFLVLLIDFDRDADRLRGARARIPDRLTDRVFVLGAWSEPEELRKTLGPYEEIGNAMARGCRDETLPIWDDPLLRHNSTELTRLRERVRPILFVEGESSGQNA